MSDFKIKPYSKVQLAKLYFPDSTDGAARHRLQRWITHCKPLSEGLESSSRKVKSHWYTPRQVKLIVEYLGEPDTD